MRRNPSIKVQQVPELVCKHLPDYDAQKIKMKQTFGMTNITLKINQQGKQSVLFRILNPVIDRKYQNRVLQKIDQKGLCPKTLYACEQYRIQQFIQNAQSPTTEQINKNPQLLKNILIKLYELHQIKLPKQLQKSFFDDVVFTEQKKKKYQQSKCLSRKKQQDQKNKQNKKQIEKEFKQLKQELLKDFTNVHQKIKKHFFQRKNHMKLTHNDVNNNNIFMIEDETAGKKKLVLLDFQYACYSFPAYDIANLLNQCCIEYFDKMPGFNVYKKVSLEEIHRTCQAYPGKYEGIDKDVLFFLSICNYFWALWSLQARSTQHFSAVEHGKARLELYKFYSDKISVP